MAGLFFEFRSVLFYDILLGRMESKEIAENKGHERTRNRFD